MKGAITKYKTHAIGAVLGTMAGWSYWYFVGCSTGSCAITSNPVSSTFYGAFMGGLIGSMFGRNK